MQLFTLSNYFLNIFQYVSNNWHRDRPMWCSYFTYIVIVISNINLTLLEMLAGQGVLQMVNKRWAGKRPWLDQNVFLSAIPAAQLSICFKPCHRQISCQVYSWQVDSDMRAGWRLLLSIEINARECSAAPSRLTQCMSLTLHNDLFTQPRCQPALNLSLFYLEFDCNICDRRNKGEMGMSRFERLVATCKCDFAKNENGLSGENDHQESEPLSLTHSRCKTGRLPSQMQGVQLKTCNVVGPTGWFISFGGTDCTCSKMDNVQWCCQHRTIWCEGWLRERIKLFQQADESPCTT